MDLKRWSIAVALICIMSVSAFADTLDYARFNRRFGQLPLKELNRRGWDNIRRDNLDSAAAFYAISISRYSESLPLQDMERVGIAFINTGYIWLYARNNPELAYPFLDNALKIGEKYDLPQVKIGANDNMGKIYANYNNYSRAKALYSKAFGEAVANRMDWGVTMAFIDLLTLTAKNGSTQDIQEEIDAVAEYGFAPSSPMGRYCKLVAQAFRQLYAGNGSRAMGLMEQASREIDVVYDRERYVAYHWLLTGYAYMANKDYSSGVDCFKVVEMTARTKGVADLSETACESLMWAYRKADNPDSARYYQFQALQIKDSLYNAGKYDVIKDLESESALSGMRKEIVDARFREEKSRIVIILISIGSVVALVLLALVLVSNCRLKSSNRELFRKNMELANAHAAPEVPSVKKPRQSSLSGEEARKILDKVHMVLSSSAEVYNSDFSLERLAELADVKPQNISKAISDLTDKNLSILIAEYRIHKVCQMFASPQTAGRLTIESMAESVGYRSRTHFTKVFKSVTGMTPSEFIRQAKAKS